MADIPGISADGTTTDRAGRTAVAFSIHTGGGGGSAIESLLFAPDTGEVLGYEDLVTKNYKNTHFHVPETDESATYTKREYVSALPK
jgi:hypothetical protein